MDLEAVISVAAGLTAVARADRNGNVTELAGSLDGESIGAVVAMSRTPLEKVSQLLGLGELRDWSFAFAETSLFVHNDDLGCVLAMGKDIKNVEGTLKRVFQALGAS
jgi:hypothetical protein